MKNIINFNMEKSLVMSLIGFVVILIAKYLFTKIIHANSKLDRDHKRRWKVNIETTLYVLFIIFICFVWANEIKFMAISLMAFAVALVLAGKELIMCLTGFLYKTLISDSVKTGNRIEINGLRGDIYDRGLLSTTLLEIGPGEYTHQYTGRSIIIPNSYFLLHRIINESFLKEYVLHTFTIPIGIQSDILSAEEILTKIAHDECRPFLENATKYINHLQMKRDVETPSPEPRIHLRFITSNELHFLVRIAVPLLEKGTVEQNINREFIRQRESWYLKS